MRIDSHQHFWDVSRTDYGWLTPDMTGLYRDFAPDDLLPHLSDCKVDGTVLVQAAPSVEETRYLLAIAERTDFVRGVVGWVDMNATDAPAIINELAQNPYLKGLRPMLQDIEETDWILNPAFMPALEVMAAKGLTFDALITAQHFETIRNFAKQNSTLQIVIDHAAKPQIGRHVFSEWAESLESLSKCENVFCKVSGLWTEAEGKTSDDIIRPYLKHLGDCFGAYRLMWGSDWPVLNLAGTYEDWMSQVERLIDETPTLDRRNLFGKTAERFYGL